MLGINQTERPLSKRSPVEQCTPLSGEVALVILTTNDSVACAYVVSHNGHADSLRVLIEAGGTELLMLTKSKDVYRVCSRIRTRTALGSYRRASPRGI